MVYRESQFQLEQITNENESGVIFSEILELAQNFKNPKILRGFILEKLKSEGLKSIDEDLIDKKITEIFTQIENFVIEEIKKYGEESFEAIKELEITGKGEYIKLTATFDYDNETNYSFSYEKNRSDNPELHLKDKNNHLIIELPIEKFI